MEKYGISIELSGHLFSSGIRLMGLAGATFLYQRHRV